MAKFKLGISIGVGIGVLVAAVLAIWVFRDPIPPLDRSEYEAARNRWRQQNVENYDMQVVFSGDQVGDYDVSVRDGRVTSLRRNGQPLPDRGAAWRSMSVDGMFEILEVDLGRIEKTAEKPGAKPIENPPATDPTAGCRTSVEFDPQWGFPRRYRQIQLGGNRTTSEWRISGFSPIAIAIVPP